MRRLSLVFALFTLLACLVSPKEARAERLRDLVDAGGARENQLVGYGLVTGLAGTGDDVSVPFTAQSVLSMLRRLGVQVDSPQIRLRNVAAVIVTAQLPPFAKQGTKIDITVASVGNARSLSGGMLVQTMLKGADQKTYALAQGNLVLGGIDARGASGSSVRQGSLTAGRIAEGAIVEREVASNIVEGGALRLELRTPGFTVASRIAEAVNQKFPGTASAIDGGVVKVKVPAGYETKPVELMAALEELEVIPVRRARVVINERTGTIVAGGDVRLSPAAVVHGNLTIVVKEAAVASQPVAPFGTGSTAVLQRSDVKAEDAKTTVGYMKEAPTLADVAQALGALGLSPRELAGVLQALRGANVLEAELVIQ
ncbi:MAG: flagellar basal body P-ring protein FlgI [Labilithrix sp.]|nr:flagellar basal body P-ring protein FlgI [Labilithrix sp.]MBX3220518.1 flagellar basal body P-ring protein FlgI [Labilithrix sp.]